MTAPRKIEKVFPNPVGALTSPLSPRHQASQASCWNGKAFRPFAESHSCTTLKPALDSFNAEFFLQRLRKFLALGHISGIYSRCCCPTFLRYYRWPKPNRQQLSNVARVRCQSKYAAASRRIIKAARPTAAKKHLNIATIR